MFWLNSLLVSGYSTRAWAGAIAATYLLAEENFLGQLGSTLRRLQLRLSDALESWQWANLEGPDTALVDVGHPG